MATAGSVPTVLKKPTSALARTDKAQASQEDHPHAEAWTRASTRRRLKDEPPSRKLRPSDEGKFQMTKI